MDPAEAETRIATAILEREQALARARAAEASLYHHRQQVRTLKVGLTELLDRLDKLTKSL